MYLVMELAQHGSMCDLMYSKGGLNEKRAKYMFLQVVLGLKYIHERGYVHRDIKLENVLVFENDQVKIGDFGLSIKAVDANGFVVLTEAMHGTEYYLAPENWIEALVNPFAGDIWSSGVLLFTLFYRVFPYETSEPKDVLLKKMKTSAYKTCLVNQSNELTDLIEKMLEFEAGKRMILKDIANHQWFAVLKTNVI